jgi:uncharacterized protein
MAQDLFHYEKMVENALRGVVRDALARVASEGPRGAHHFYITFATHHPGVAIPDSLRERFPAEMTIVLQHQYWDLEVRDDAFSVTLSFQKQLERLTIPLAAIRGFADPSVNFALEFAAPDGEAAAGEAKPPAAALAGPSHNRRRTDKPDREQEEAKPRPAGEVVALDNFRKR